MLKSIVNGAEHDIISIPMKGKNLISLPTTSKTINGVEWTCTGGVISGNGSTASAAYQDCIVITPSEIRKGTNYTSYYSINARHGIKLPAGTYTFSADYVYTSDETRLRLVVGREGTSPRYYTATEIFSGDTFTTDGEDYAVLVCGAINTVSKVEFKNIMLNIGSTALPYEPYGYQNGWEVRDNQNRLIWGREDELQTTTGTLPFKGYDLPIKVNSLLGSAAQNGTPSPNSPIIPEMCGVRTENICPSATAETKTNNGITAASNGSGTYHVSGTATADADIRFNVKSFWIPQSIGNYHDGTFSMFNSAIYDNTAVKLAFYYQGTKLDDWGLTTRNKTSTTYSNMSEKYCDAIGFTVKSGVTVDFTISPEFTNDGVLPTEFEPYGYKISFDNNGENLFDCDRTDGIIDNSYINKSNGEIVADANYYISYPIYVLKDVDYVWTFDSIQAHTAPTVGFYDASDNLIGFAPHGSNIKYFVFTTPSGCKYIRASVYKCNDLQKEAMLNLGSTPLPYSTYINETIPIYLSEVPTIRRIKKLVLTGNETYVATTASTHYRCRTTLVPKATTQSTIAVLSTHYCASAGARDGTITLTSDGGSVYFTDDTNAVTAETFKSYVAAQYANGTPVTLWYVLDEWITGIVNEPLCKISTYADELTTIKVNGLSAPLYGIGDYKDILNLSTGVVTRKIKKYEFTGNEGWNKGNYPQSGSYQFFTPKPSGIIANPSSWIITHFKTVATLNGSAFGSYLSLYPEISILPENASANHFKNWLAAQYANGTPVTIWYILETPETETVTVPTGMTGEIEGYLKQISTPTPTNQSIPKWNGKEETGGTYAVTVYTPPEISTTTGKNTLTVDTTLAPYNTTIKGHIKYTYWGKIREDVRSGLAQTKFPVGTILYDNEDATTGRAFQVVGYDKHFDPSLTARGYNHSMTLCQLKLSGPWQYDAIEAFLYTTVEMQPGTYKFKIPNYDTTYGGNKTYYFTSTASVPVDSQIVLKWDYQKPPASVTAYAGPNPQTNTTPLTGFNALTLTEWVEGESPEAIDLGTIKLSNNDPDSAYGKLNHIHRARYGSNNYYQSGLRQLLNTDLAANNWWHPTTIFDRPYANRTANGYLRSLNEDFINVLATPEITHIANNVFEYPSLDGRTFTLNTEYRINTDKVFLLSHTEVGLSSSPNVGTILDYYSTHNTNNDRIKYRIDNGNASYWWFRTPYPTGALSFRICHTSGALGYSGAVSSFGVAPAHIIQ